MGETLVPPLADLLPWPPSATVAGLSAVAAAPASKGGPGRSRDERVEWRSPISRRHLVGGGGAVAVRGWAFGARINSDKGAARGLAGAGRSCGSGFGYGESGIQGNGHVWWRWGRLGPPSVARRDESLAKVKLPRQ
jgi:hypothetical protein